MKGFWKNPGQQLERPLRALGWTIGIVSLLFAVASPFAEVPDHREFFALGVCYAAVLGIFAVGFALLPGALRNRVLITTWVAIVVAYALFWLLLYLEWKRHIHSISGWERPMKYAIYAWGGALGALSLRGWYRYSRRGRQPLPI